MNDATFYLYFGAALFAVYFAWFVLVPFFEWIITGLVAYFGSLLGALVRKETRWSEREPSYDTPEPSAYEEALAWARRRRLLRVVGDAGRSEVA